MYFFFPQTLISTCQRLPLASTPMYCDLLLEVPLWRPLELLVVAVKLTSWLELIISRIVVRFLEMFGCDFFLLFLLFVSLLVLLLDCFSGDLYWVSHSKLRSPIVVFLLTDSPGCSSLSCGDFGGCQPQQSWLDISERALSRAS
ncbi:unnamed protein product [Moneuplotes crassus]|uniref:Uncharacterized protein n=1 Tax=Euplotes crassus TaxID=5936 RepID=A0AAD1XPH9_EUPCR|nr:unnamed protein product [Moneuplotes crassus]